MPDLRPTTIATYQDWLKQERMNRFDEREHKYYDTTAASALDQFTQSIFWQSILSNVQTWNNEYKIKTQYDLFSTQPDSSPLIKPWSSVIEKSMRKNVLQNINWPKEPDDGWITTENYFERFGDLIRTTFVVKYLDGVDFLADKLSGLASLNTLQISRDYEARDEGYYALHLSVLVQVELHTRQWETINRNLTIEIQITTQLQEVIRKLLHTYYEERRVQSERDALKWQWKYRSEDFFANYLGHILHYVEGAILEVRDKKK